jgi:hypothetical protein
VQQQPGDSIVFVLIILFLIFLIVRRWMSFSFVKDFLFNKTKKEPKTWKGEVPDLLREYGYEPVEGKTKIPISIELDEKTYESRMFIDYLAIKDEELFVVIVAKERKPLRKTGAGIREHLFPYFLLYRPAGLVYVDKEKGKLSLVKFSHSDLYEKQKKFPLGIMIAFVVGMLAMWLIK